jgi:hypothetical protein
MAKKDALLKIDYVPSKNTGNPTTTFGGGTTSIDTSAFLLRDGTRTMLANLNMGGFSIVGVGYVDGIDVSAFWDVYQIHILNENAHHNKVHDIDGSDHTGVLAWTKVNKTGSNLTDIVTRSHTALQNITPNDHHNQIHAITGSDHTVVGSAFDLIGLSTTNTLSVLTPSANVSTGIERILKSSSSGNLNLASLTTILINSTAELTLNPVGNIILDSQAGATIPGGTIQDDLGAYNRKWRTLFVAELYAETLVAQDVISTIGGRILVAPTTTLIADVSNVATTIDVKHNNLQSGDFVVLQTAPNGAVQFESMRITSAATTISGGFRYSVTRNLDGSNSPNISGNWDTWFAGDAVVDITDGYIDLTSTSTMLNHFGPVVAIYDRTSVGSWAGLTPTAALGNIKGFVDFSTDNFGIAIGNNLTLTPSTGFIGLTADATNGIRLFNTPLKMYNGAIETVHIAGWNDIWIGPNSSDKKLSWDGTTLTITGVVNVVGGNAATIGNITGAANLLRNSSFEVDSNGDGLSDNFVIYNNDGASVPTYAGRVYGEKSTWAQRISWIGTNASTKGIAFFAGNRRANVDYMITFWARTNTATDLFIAHNFPPTSTTNLSWPTANNSWQFYAAKLRWPSDNADDWYLTIGWPITNGWIDFDNIMIYEGSEIVPYYPSQSDIITNGGLINMPFVNGGSGLYLTSSFLGFWNGSSFRTYLDNSGNFYFKGASGAYVTWDGTRLFGGTSQTFDSSANWYVDSTTGALVAGQGQVYITNQAINLTWNGIYNTTTYGSNSKFRWYLTSSSLTTLIAELSLKENPNFVYATTVDPLLRERALELRSSNEVFAGLILRTNSGNREINISSDGFSYFVGGVRGGTLNIGSVVTNSLDVFGTALVNGNTIWHSGNDGTGSGLSADNLRGLTLTTATQKFNTIPFVGNDGVMEIGRYIDFHETNTNSTDFSARIWSTSGTIYTSSHIISQGVINSNFYFQTTTQAALPSATAGYVKIVLRSDNALVAVMPSGNVRVLATN